MLKEYSAKTPYRSRRIRWL